MNNSRFASHLSEWAWSKGYQWHSNVCFLSRPSPWNQQRRKIKFKPLRQKWWLHFSTSKRPFICSSNNSASSVYSRACVQYSDFLDRSQLLSQNILKQGYIAPMLKLSPQKVYSRHHDLVVRYEISLSQMTIDLFHFT